MLFAYVMTITKVIMQSPFVFDAHGTVIVMMDASDNYQKKVNVANTYFGYHKKPNPCCQGYSGNHKNYCHR